MSAAPVTVLGLGSMGHALAAAFLAAGHPTTVWNRTAAKADALVERGAARAATVREATAASPLVVACLLDHDSVHQALDPVVDTLRGRTLVNLTNNTPEQARELARWADRHGIGFVDGGIMAVPATIATPEAFVLYSGPEAVLAPHRATLKALGEVTYLGEDVSTASLVDLSLLAGMSLMFAGFFQSVAMATSQEGVRAAEFTELLVPWLTSMAAVMPAFAAEVDAADGPPGPGTSMEGAIAGTLNVLRASQEQGVRTALLDPYMDALREQAAAGLTTFSPAAVVALLTTRP